MRRSVFFLMIVGLVWGCQDKAEELNVDHVLKQSEIQLTYQLKRIDQLKTEKLISPRSVDEQGTLHMVPVWEWTVGFFPGSLWMMYDYTQDEFWRQKAEAFTTVLESQQYNNRTHDTGFMMYCSYGKGCTLTSDSTSYRAILIQSAKSLASRYNDHVKAIKSWNHGKDKWQFPVIIDNMMNLELLFWAAKATGDSTFRNIAINHAMVTLEHHYRIDNSSYHLVDFDPKTGHVIKKETVQGLANESAWARGQAWGLYGYILCYRETGIPMFLTQAEKIADYIMHHPALPADKIPLWDYDVTSKEDTPRDASAAAVTASALFELAQYSDKSNIYRTFGKEIVSSLASSSYFAEIKTNEGYLLKHSTGSIPHGNEIDVPLVYADYYFIEALVRLKKLEKNLGN